MNPITVRKPARRFVLSMAMLTMLAGNGIVQAQEPSEEATDDAGKPIQMKLNFKSNACMAHLGVEYLQRGEHVHVNAEIGNDDCGASAGTYTIKVRIRGDDGEVQNLDYPESWAREDASPVEIAKDYFVGENVDVVRVRARDLKCQCAVAEAEQ